MNQYQVDISQVAAKLDTVQERRRVLIQRHRHAQTRHRAQCQIRRVDTTAAMARFERFENRVDQMEAEANLVNFGRKPALSDEIRSLGDPSLDEELEALKAEASKS